MELALLEAEQAAREGEVPVGAVIVRGEEVIARGYNLREQRQDPTLHAEVVAIQRAAAALGSWRLEGCTIYVTLEPCSMCAGAMVLARVQRCVYGCTDPKGGFLGTLADLSSWPQLNHHFEVTPGVLEQRCREQLQAFFRALRR